MAKIPSELGSRNYKNASTYVQLKWLSNCSQDEEKVEEGVDEDDSDYDAGGSSSKKKKRGKKRKAEKSKKGAKKKKKKRNDSDISDQELPEEEEEAGEWILQIYSGDLQISSKAQAKFVIKNSRGFELTPFSPSKLANLNNLLYV